jgi:ZIP family zinc transporter
MWKAALWGGIVGSVSLIGALCGLFFNINKKAIGFVMAYGTGILIGAAAFELLDQSLRDGGIEITALAFILGSIIFTLFDLAIAVKGGSERKRSREKPKVSSGMAIFIGSVFDSIPEAVIIGVSMVGQETLNWLLIIAIAVSNIPEGLSSSTGLKDDGYSKARIIILWTFIMVLSLICSMAGFILLRGKSQAMVAVISSFAAGGVVSMAASTMMPEAYEEGGPVVGLVAALGLISSLLLTKLV